MKRLKGRPTQPIITEIKLVTIDKNILITAGEGLNLEVRENIKAVLIIAEQGTNMPMIVVIPTGDTWAMRECLTDIKKNTEVNTTTAAEKDTQTEVEEDTKTTTTPPQLDIHQEEILVIPDKPVKVVEDMKAVTSPEVTAAVLEDMKSTVIPAVATSTQKETEEEKAVLEASPTELEEDMKIVNISEVEDTKKTVTLVVQEDTKKEATLAANTSITVNTDIKIAEGMTNYMKEIKELTCIMTTQTDIIKEIQVQGKRKEITRQ